MKVLRIVRGIWLTACIGALIVAQLAFTGTPTSEVAGNLTFFLLVLCLPSSVVAYPCMFAVADLFAVRGVYPFNSRIALTAVWVCYFLFGALQWYIVPAVIGRLRSRPRFTPGVRL